MKKTDVLKILTLLPALLFMLCAEVPAKDVLLASGTGHDAISGEDFEDPEEEFFEGDYQEEAGEENAEKSELEKTLQEWLSASRFTLRHEYSYKIEEPRRTVNNRSSFRFELSRSLGERFFLRIDSKINLFYRDDHRIRSDLEKEFLIETESREAYLQTDFGNVSLKLGYQVLVWGEADGQAITDVVSPRNMSEFIFIPLEESRVSQMMIVADSYGVLGGDLTMFYVPKAEFDEKPDPEGEYYINFFPEIPIRTEEYGSEKNLNEYGLRWKLSSGKSDMALMTASLIENSGAYEDFRLATDLTLRLKKACRRYLMTGIAFNYVAGSYLWKGEIAGKSKKTFNDINFDLLERNVLDAAFGVEYTAVDYRLGADVFNSHIFDWNESILVYPEDMTSMTLNWNKRFMNDDLSVTVSAMLGFNYNDKIYMLESGYNYDDRTKIEFALAIMEMEKETSLLWPYRDQSRMTAKVSYLF